jgi:hypothetical protein
LYSLGIDVYYVTIELSLMLVSKRMKNINAIIFWGFFKNNSEITFDPHLPVDWMSDVALEFVDFPVVKLGLALEIRGGEELRVLFGGVGIQVATGPGCRRRRCGYQVFGTNVTVQVKERVQTNGVEQERGAADDQKVRVASHVDASF